MAEGEIVPAEQFLATREHQIMSAIKTHFLEIENKRKENAYREISGHILDGNVIFSDESTWGERSVKGGSFEEERARAESGAIAFHSHPESVGFEESMQDIIATHVRMGEATFSRDGVISLIPKKLFTLEEIRQIVESTWQEACDLTEGDDTAAYWLQKEMLQERLPYKIVKLNVEELE